MRNIRRAADWLALVAGSAVMVSYVWHNLLGIGMAMLFLVGILIVFLACLALIHPELFVVEAVMVVTGGFLIAVPWLFGFDTDPAASVTAWVAGAIAVVAGLIALPPSTAMYRRIVPPQPNTRSAVGQ